MKLKILLLNVAVTVFTAVACFGIYRVYVQWTRVDAMWAWVNAQAQTMSQAQRPPPAAPESTAKVDR